MCNPNIPKRGYILAAVIGALGGSIFVVLVTRAIPRLMPQIMAEMMSKMKREGFDPAAMCQCMKTLFNEHSESLETLSA